MSRIFVSYSRQSQEIARSLVADIQELGYVVWMDKDLSGGQAWWDQILSTIRSCDVFVFLLDADGLNSIACQREFRYAAALGKSVLPVLVADGISTNLLPPELSTLQFIDYRQPDRKSGFALARALGAVPPVTALPDPLPAPPEVPVSYLGGLTKKLETTSTLSYEEQSVLLVDLRRSLRDAKTSHDGRALLKKLRARHDLFATIAEDIDELVGAPIPLKPPPPPPTTPPPIAIPKTPAIPRAEAPVPPIKPSRAVISKKLPGLAVGVAVGLVPGALALLLPGQRIAPWPMIVAGISGGIVAQIIRMRWGMILAAAGGLAVGYIVWLVADIRIEWVSYGGPCLALGLIVARWIFAEPIPEAPVAVSTGIAAKIRNGATGAAIGCAVGSVLFLLKDHSDLSRSFSEFQAPIVFAAAGGAITAMITGRHRRVIFIALAGFALGSGIWLLVDHGDEWSPSRAGILGGGAGAILGAIAGAVLKKWKRWP